MVIGKRSRNNHNQNASHACEHVSIHGKIMLLKISMLSNLVSQQVSPSPSLPLLSQNRQRAIKCKDREKHDIHIIYREKGF